MKSYDDYFEEYQQAIKSGVKKGDGYIIKECVYISMKWQTENNWNPWDDDAISRLEELKKNDIRLYQAVLEGVEIVARMTKEGQV